MPRLIVDGLELFFPYEAPYPEQLEYMKSIKKALDAKGHSLLEMPSGTGKTMALLSVITAYQKLNPELRLLYCSRTVSEIEKVVDELKNLAGYMKQEGIEINGVWMAMSSRRNLCLNDKVTSLSTNVDVDSKCYGFTANWIRRKAILNVDIEECPFFENLIREDATLKPGIYSLSNIQQFAEKANICPYFMARRSLETATIVVFSYQYLLDPKISDVVMKNFDQNCIVVFDEAHNIDNVCIDSLSVSITPELLKSALVSVRILRNQVDDVSSDVQKKLESEYRSIISGLSEKGSIEVSPSLLSSASLPQDVVNEAIPGSIRKAKHFLNTVRRLLNFFSEFLSSTPSMNLYPLSLLQSLMNALTIESKPLKFLPTRFASLIETLEISDFVKHLGLQRFLHFLQLLATYSDGFLVVIEKFGRTVSGEQDSRLQFCCLDSSFAIKPIFAKYRSVVITSGTISPLSMYTKLLRFKPVISKAIPMTLKRECIYPMIVARGSDQVPLTTKFEARGDPSVIRNFGGLIARVCSCVPDGVVIFFPSYKYLEETVMAWSEMGMLSRILVSKLLFVETSNNEETVNALENYRYACDCGRGGLLFAVSRGKLSEGLDFSNQYGRCVVVVGVPYINTDNQVLCARLDYLRRTFSINESEFLSFDAMRITSQCVGRIIRSKDDYGIIVLADKGDSEGETTFVDI